MEELWPPPSDEVAETIRTLCQRLLPEAESLVESMSPPALSAQNHPALLSDASLIEEDRQLNRSDLLQWVTSNIQRPGIRVEPYVGRRAAEYISDLVSRGIVPDFAEGWRVALSIAWRYWLEQCTTFITDRNLLVEVLDLSAKSMIQYALDSVEALRDARLGASVGHADAEAISLIQMIANGAPVAQDFAEVRLNYRLDRHHVGLILWVEDLEQLDDLDEAVAVVRSGVSARSALVVRASATSRWVWVSGPEPPNLDHVQKLTTSTGAIRAAVGRTGRDLEGFRDTHQDALAAQALVVRLASPRRYTAYAEVELIDALTKDRGSARRFVLNTLGTLADADPALREALLTYLQCGFNTTRAAAQLYAHRNTVERRVSRANELSAVKMDNNPAHVAAALLVLEIAPDLVSEASG